MGNQNDLFAAGRIARQGDPWPTVAETGWDGSAADGLDLSNVPAPEADDSFDALDAIDALDIDPEDELAPGEQPRPVGESAPVSPALPFVVTASAPKPFADARRAPTTEQAAIGPASASLASLDNLLALSRKSIVPAMRLEAYLSHLPVASRERILMIMVENKWNASDPEVVVAMLFAHLEALGHTIPVAIDAATADAVAKLVSGLEGYADVPQLIEQALLDFREAIGSGLASIHQAGADAAEATRGIADAFAQNLRDALRESAELSAEAAMRGIAKAGELESAEAKKKIDGWVDGAERAFQVAALKMSGDAVAILKASLGKAKREDERWKWAAIGSSGALLGALAAMIAIRLIH